MLSVVVLVGLSDTVPLSGLTRNLAVSPGAGFPSFRALTVNVKASPGAPDPGWVATCMDTVGGGGGGVTAVAVTLTDALPADAVTVYEPEAFFPNHMVTDARPLLEVEPLMVVGVPG